LLDRSGVCVHTSDDVIFTVWADRQGIPPGVEKNGKPDVSMTGNRLLGWITTFTLPTCPRCRLQRDR